MCGACAWEYGLVKAACSPEGFNCWQRTVNAVDENFGNNGLVRAVLDYKPSEVSKDWSDLLVPIMDENTKQVTGKKGMTEKTLDWAATQTSTYFADLGNKEAQQYFLQLSRAIML